MCALDDHRVGVGSGVDATWAAYARGWTAWNHVRCATSLAAAVALGAALRSG
ncbi:MAG: hypothetical protein K1X95_14490 [Acidimicrobiia bacterium]|nr:hypothetical protein [Acidimicrobiia bacterium]